MPLTPLAPVITDEQISLIEPGLELIPRYVEQISNNTPCPVPLIAATVRGTGNLITAVVAGLDWIVATISIFEVVGISCLNLITPIVPDGPTALLHELTIHFQPGKISPELPVIC